MAVFIDGRGRASDIACREARDAEMFTVLDVAATTAVDHCRFIPRYSPTLPPFDAQQ